MYIKKNGVSKTFYVLKHDHKNVTYVYGYDKNSR